MGVADDSPAPATPLLDAQQEARLAAVLERYLADLEEGRPCDVEALVAEHPDLAEPLRSYFESIAALEQAAAELGGRALSVSGPQLPWQLGDFQIVRQIGRGGMGIVYEARQLSLDRRVALKVLPLAALLDQKQIARFQLESRAAAQLHHPHIVPVFAVGVDRGVHYYAMQYIEGQSLDEVIAELRETGRPLSRTAQDLAPSGKAAPTAAPAPDQTTPILGAAFSGSTASRSTLADLSGVAQLGMQAAEALHHAHQFGIVHRDVKPSNLLLDQEGQLWVTDFGLARMPADAGLTASGELLGTLRYMSPEQAAGQAALVDHRSDIYSLGITLYELLVLRPAFTAADHQLLLTEIAVREPPAPRRLNRAVPADLENVILKAIAKSPHDRYQNAQELADDLRRFVEGRPTLARRPGWGVRASRWAGRHRAAVWSALAVGLVMLVGLSLSCAIILQKHRQTLAALDREKTYYRQARAAVDRFTAGPAERLAELPGVESLRRELLEDALGYYEEFLRQAATDPVLEQDLAAAQFRIGAILEQTGQAERALAAYREAEKAMADLAARQPGTAQRRQWALCQNNIALILARQGKAAEARQRYQKAIGTLAPLAEGEGAPRDPQVVRDLALAYTNLAALEGQASRPAEAQQSSQKAIALLTPLTKGPDADVRLVRQLALSYNHQGLLESDRNVGAAERACREAMGLLRGLSEKQPGDFQYQSDLALAHNNLGALLLRQDRRNDAVVEYDEALRLQRELVRRSPQVRRFRRELSTSLNNIARLRSENGDHARAMTAYQEARAVLEELLRDDPQDLIAQSELGGVLNNAAMAEEQVGRPAEALRLYGQAVEWQRKAFDAAPAMARFREFLSKHYYNYARLLRSEGRIDESAKITLARKELWPRNPERLFTVACELGLASTAARKHSPAAKSGDGSAGRYEQLAIQALAEAIEAGFSDGNRLRTTSDLDAVRGRAEYSVLLDRLSGQETRR